MTQQNPSGYRIIPQVTLMKHNTEDNLGVNAAREVPGHLASGEMSRLWEATPGRQHALTLSLSDHT